MKRSLTLLGLALILTGCGDDICANTVVKTVVAPGAARKAVLFERNCGATTGFSTQVAVLGSRQRLDERATVFVADDNDGAAPAAAWGGPWADVRWLWATQLLVTYDGRSKIFEREARIGPVAVAYRSAGAEAG